MNELIIVRHGEAGHMVNGHTGGWTNTRLTDLGRTQARLTGERLVGRLSGRGVCFLSSDLARTAETSAFIAECISAKPAFHPELRELNNGIAAGMTLDEARRIERPITAPVCDWVPYPEGESWRMMSTRVRRFMYRVAKEESDVMLIVTHGNSGAAIIDWWLGLEIGAHVSISYDLDPCSITHLVTRRWTLPNHGTFEEKIISRLNDTAHLVRTV